MVIETKPKAEQEPTPQPEPTPPNGTPAPAPSPEAPPAESRLAVVSEELPAQWHATPRELALLKRSYASDNINDDEFFMFLAVAQRQNLDPFKRQIYVVKYRDKAVVQTGIDGYRALAVRTGKLAGQEPPVWIDRVEHPASADGKTPARLELVAYGPALAGHEVWPYPASHPPFAAIASVWRAGVPRPFVYVALLGSFMRTNRDGKPSNLWGTMPETMLYKCALAQSLRAAFPDELAGVYTAEEMDQALNDAKPQRPPDALTAADTKRLTSAWTKSTTEHRGRAVDWLRAHGYTGERAHSATPDGRPVPDHVRVLNDFTASDASRTWHIDALDIILAGGDPPAEGGAAATFDPESVPLEGQYVETAAADIPDPTTGLVSGPVRDDPRPGDMARPRR